MENLYPMDEELFERLSEQIVDYEGNIYLEVDDYDCTVVFKGSYQADYEGDILSYIDTYITCEVFDESGEVISNNFENSDLIEYLMKNSY